MCGAAGSSISSGLLAQCRTILNRPWGFRGFGEPKEAALCMGIDADGFICSRFLGLHWILNYPMSSCRAAPVVLSYLMAAVF